MPIQKSKISYTLDLNSDDFASRLNKIKPSKRKEVTELIGVTILDEIRSYTEKGQSPVSGGSYKSSLSKEYAKKTGKKISDLFLEGDMLGNLSFSNFKDRVTIKITDPLQKKKAYNHNVGDTLPQRQFMPDDDESFKKPIIDKVKRILDDAAKE